MRIYNQAAGVSIDLHHVNLVYSESIVQNSYEEDLICLSHEYVITSVTAGIWY